MKVELAFYIIFIVFSFLNSNDASRVPSVELNLIQNLTSSDTYDVNARPVSRADDAIDVSIDIGFPQIVSLDEPTQVLSTNIYLRLYWNDVSLTWNPGDHDNVTSVHIYAERIWRPDITLYNDVGTERREAEKLYPATVTYEGHVSYLSSALFHTSCELDMTYFPWDSQGCELVLGSWSYDTFKLKLHTVRDSADTSMFIRNGEYELDGVPVVLMSQVYPCCAAPYETAVFTVQLTRKPMFYIINLVLPCMFVSLVGLLVFLLPPTSGEKISLALTVLLASTVFLLIVAEAIPPQSSSVPLISKYFEAVIMLLAMTSIVTVFIINIHNRGDHYSRPPHVIRVLILDWLARLVFLRGVIKGKTENKKQSNIATFCKENGTKLNDQTRVSQIIPDIFTLNAEKPVIPANDTTNRLLSQILHQLRGSETKDTELRDDIVNEWVFVAMVLDRLFFIIFFITMVVTSLTILIH